MSAGQSVGAPTFEPVCLRCGWVPTKEVTFYQNIGMVVSRQTSSASGHLCRRCIREYFSSYTLTTLFLGWWGLVSFILTPFILLNNVGRYLMSLSLADPMPGALANPTVNEAALPPVGVGSPKLKLIYGAVVSVVLLGIVAYNNVGFMEKHAPSLNATLHNGEITESADAEYAVTKAVDDINALSEPVKDQKTWAGFRKEFLSREPYLNDLKAQNAKLKSALAQESASSTALDVCDRLAREQFFPAVDGYASNMVKAFALLHANEAGSEAVASALDKLQTEEAAIHLRFAGYYGAVKEQHCDK